jgi:DNA-binding response OmpR family regulator
MDKKILLIEDDAVSRRLMELVLTKEGYRVTTANNGLEGLRQVKLVSPDLLVLDVMLPGLDGFEICYRLRSDPVTATLPIMVLSAKSQESDKNAALQVGANVFLPKPVDRMVLLDQINKLLNLANPISVEIPLASDS